MRLFLLLVLLCTASWTKGCTTGHIRLVDQRGREVEGRSGIVQLCLKSTWSTVCGFDGWSSHAANIACRQLGYHHFLAGTMNYTTSATEENPLSEETISITCSSGEFRLTECLRSPQNRRGCYDERFDQYVYSNVTCKRANCVNGDMVLKDGSTNREGRVEVCVDGRLGTVCGEGWGDTEAGLVCARLGLPTDVYFTLVDKFGASSIQPIYNMTCSHIQGNHFNCTATPAPDSCDHSMDLGVSCLTHQEAYIATVEKLRICESEVTTPLLLSTSITTDCNGNSSGGATDTTTSTTITSARHVTEESGIIEALAVLTGLLAAALVVVTMGWIVSCVYWQGRCKRRRGHTNNKEWSANRHNLDNTLVHDDGTVETHSQTNYSSTSPSYEQLLGVKEETGYDVINRRGAPRPHPPMIFPGSQNPTSDQNYSTLKAVNNYHVLEPTIMTGEMVRGERVDMTDDQRVLQQNLQLTLHISDPQIHENPAPQN